MKRKKLKVNKSKAQNKVNTEIVNKLIAQNMPKVQGDYAFDMLHLAARLEGGRAGEADIAALAQRYGMTVDEIKATLPPPLLGPMLRA